MAGLSQLHNLDFVNGDCYFVQEILRRIYTPTLYSLVLMGVDAADETEDVLADAVVWAAFKELTRRQVAASCGRAFAIRRLCNRGPLLTPNTLRSFLSHLLHLESLRLVKSSGDDKVVKALFKRSPHLHTLDLQECMQITGPELIAYLRRRSTLLPRRVVRDFYIYEAAFLR